MSGLFGKRGRSSKSSRDKRASSSAAAEAPPAPPSRFRDDASEERYIKMLEKLKSQEPKYFDPHAVYEFPVRELFNGTTLGLLLTLATAFNADFVMAWYANMYGAGGGRVRSYIPGRDVEITIDDLHDLLMLSTEGEVLWPSFRHDSAFDWTAVNAVLRNAPGMKTHITDVDGLTREAYLIQYVLRHTVFPKSGDVQRVNTTLSLATYFCMTKKQFNVAGAILAEMWQASHYVKSKKPKRLPYGHLIFYILEEKYGSQLFDGMVREFKVKPFKERDITQVMKRFPAVVARDDDAAAEADAAGVAEEHEQMQEDLPHFEMPGGSFRQSPLFQEQPPQFHHQAPPYNEHRDPYIPMMWENQQVMRADLVAIREEQARMREWHEAHMKAMADAEARAIARNEAVRNSLEEVRTSVEEMRQLTSQFGTWWSHQGPPPPSDQLPSDAAANARWE